MKFTIVEATPFTGTNEAFLVLDNWDDWGKFQTQFNLTIFDENGTDHVIGSLKIGSFGLLAGSASEKENTKSRVPNLPPTFEKLDESFFSLGQSENYYEMLYTLPGSTLASEILIALRDCAYNLDIYESAKDEYVMGESLIRSVQKTTLTERFHHLAHGNAKLTKFEFDYHFPSHQNVEGPILTFKVSPSSIPPTNTHVIIGRNGVGKTRFIKKFIKSIPSFPNDITKEKPEEGYIESHIIPKSSLPFSGIVTIAFSAFDTFDTPDFNNLKIKYNHVGLWEKTSGDDSSKPINDDQLASSFCSSLKKCDTGLRKKRWLKIVKILESDTLFAQHKASNLIDYSENKRKDFFGQLSSGHAIVLLTITRLVEFVAERTLVLLDEPESHLHPPLLSAFIRAISTLLTNRNGIAIIATHSPVVLQETPRSCVWRIDRSRLITVARRPQIETFGENVSVLTRHIFGLEVTHSGFHNLVREAIDGNNLNYEELLQHFDNQLGSEAKAIAQGLIAERDRKETGSVE